MMSYHPTLSALTYGTACIIILLTVACDEAMHQGISVMASGNVRFGFMREAAKHTPSIYQYDIFPPQKRLRD